MVGHIEFDSKKEAQHYHELMLREKAGEICNVRVQVPYAIVIDNVHVCDYIADFVYLERVGTLVGKELKFDSVCTVKWEARVVDAKGMKTAIYRLKKKLMKAVLRIEVIEV